MEIVYLFVVAILIVIAMDKFSCKSDWRVAAVDSTIIVFLGLLLGLVGFIGLSQLGLF